MAQDVILRKVIVEVEVQPGRGRADYVAAAVRHESYPDRHTGPQEKKNNKHLRSCFGSTQAEVGYDAYLISSSDMGSLLVTWKTNWIAFA